MTYKGRIHRIGEYGGFWDEEKGGFSTPEQAFEWAKREAHNRTEPSISYWVEYERDNILRNFVGNIRR